MSERVDPTLIRVAGARVHNLRDVALTLRKNRLICFTGVSGSGKSSLAFDTLYAEGQRRYIESLSSYARQFLGQLPKPDVDQISGLAPAISIQQKTSGWNPRSTVGTITQIGDYLRVLFARAGTQRCTQCGAPIAAQTREQMIARVLALPAGTRFLLLAPKARGQKGEFKDLFADLLHAGFARVRVNGVVYDLNDPPALDRYKRHDIEVVVDRLVVRDGLRPRLADALETALAAGEGTAIVAVVDAPAEAAPADEPAPGPRRRRRTAPAPAATSDILLSAGYACTRCDLSFEPPHPQMFSFNSPQGMCPHCDGLGTRYDFDPDLLVPHPARSFLAPCIAPLRTKPGRWRRHLYEGVAKHLGISLKTPWRDLPPAARQALLYGTGDAHITFEWRTRHGVWKHGGTFEGIVAELQDKYRKSSSTFVRSYYEQFMRQTPCQVCGGARLRPQALAVTLTGADGRELNIHAVCQLAIDRAAAFFADLPLDGVRALIAAEPLKEIRARLQFLLDVGLDYLTLDRAAPTLSGGESQRIRLASQIGSGLVGVLYVLDEPSIGLHPRDNQRLLASLQRLRDMGNTVIVVEHDRDTMEAADEIVDFGPGPGVRGGRVVAQGDLAQVAAAPDSLTGAYLSNRMTIPVPAERRPVTPPPKPRARRTR
jgi:excinuclease ABC subunit A